LIFRLSDETTATKTLQQPVEADELDAAVAAAMGSRGTKSNNTVAVKA
jgi:hypothetical protein